MNVPNYIHDRLVNKEGLLTEEWQVLIGQLLEELQTNFSNEGLVAPSQTTANINIIQPKALAGTLIYDTDTNQLMVNIDGTFKAIQVA